MHARLSTIQMDPSKLDEAVARFEEEDLSQLQQLDGFRGLTMLVDRSNGKLVGTAYWDSAEQMAASEDTVNQIRQRVADTGGASEPPQVERFEVAIDTFVS